MDQLVDKLKDMGLNSYEAKVYLALLRHHPATGYEVSRASGVPQARAYDTLKSLETARFVVALSGKPTTYTPVPPEELLNRWERNFKGSITYLREALPSLNQETVEPVINLRGETALRQQAREMIEQATQAIFLELWKTDAEELSEPLRAAQARGVALNIVGYDDVHLDFVDVYPHGFARTIETSLGGRWVILAVDDREGMVGTVPLEKNRPPQGVFTRNPGLVLIIKELVVHDIFLLDVEQNLSAEMERVYGKNLMRLRKKILGNETCVGAH